MEERTLSKKEERYAVISIILILLAYTMVGIGMERVPAPRPLTSLSLFYDALFILCTLLFLHQMLVLGTALVKGKIAKARTHGAIMLSLVVVNCGLLLLQMNT